MNVGFKTFFLDFFLKNWLNQGYLKRFVEYS